MNEMLEDQRGFFNGKISINKQPRFIRGSSHMKLKDLSK